MELNEAVVKALAAEKAINGNKTNAQIAAAAGGGMTERQVGNVLRGQDPKVGQLDAVARGIGTTVTRIVELALDIQARHRAIEVADELTGPVVDFPVPASEFGRTGGAATDK